MKMNQAEKKHDLLLKPGMVLKGKWHNKRYVIKRKLGNGAIGTVYLCEVGAKLAALKISDKGTSMTVEVNVLKSLQKVQGSRLGPYLLDVDDWVSTYGNTYSFYVMEYLDGQSISTFIKDNGDVWVGVFMLQLLEDLEQLHQSGWVFGDLKQDNLIVTSAPPRLRWVDVGGTTQIGRAIKEYTEFYDRGYWGMGTRKAEPSYDLFSLVMVFLNIYYPRRFVRSKSGSPSDKQLFKKIDDVKVLAPYRYILKNALIGNYQSSAEMKAEVMNVVHRAQRKTRSQRQAKAKTANKVPFLIETAGITLIAFIYYLISIFI
ncbi:protein kinase domain-containing protein [Oceanobacillus bengalensis]|uniref:Protein kinase family protein n=1 Tax=Oceanobacillus bengalensis TaxID=1435466 RepID=A0A494YU92_9BACI|nr:serine/threonine-protein kinase [Oceanobacillus bengalensis]RKQ13714.1 protein kinase family protein [Oceanobacillus bengalensis]